MKANCKKIAKEILLRKTWIPLGLNFEAEKPSHRVPCFTHPWGSADTTECLTRSHGLIWIDKSWVKVFTDKSKNCSHF